MSALHIAVIGRGLMGGAAARHLAKAGHKVTLIGPDEPADKTAHRGVFGAHYDEGRITRRNDRHRFWAEAASAAISRYAEIEAESGIEFFAEVGGVIAGPKGSDFIADVDATNKALQIGGGVYEGAEMAEKLPHFSLPDGHVAYHETVDAGHVSPRRLAAAQSEAARRHGARIIAAEAQGIEETGAGVRIATTEGAVEADQALVATGLMTDHVLGRPLAYTVYARTIAFLEVSEAEARRLGVLPTLIYRDAEVDSPYLLPPIRYPDGRWYAKLGGDPQDRTLTSAEEIGDWFRGGGDPEVRDHLEALYRRLLPGVRIEAVTMGSCCTTFTAEGLPEIRRLSPRLSVCAAGNGAGAKCSDELGRRGAEIAAQV